MKITKAVIPAAGLGTRFLPQTKAMPKEMLPIIDKPIIQYVVEEAVSSGITDIIIVTGAHKRSIEDHFDHQYQLEEKLERDGKDELVKELRHIADMANFVYLRQKGHPGNGTPILNAAHLLNGEPFLVLWADEVFTGPKPRAAQLIEAYEQLQAPIIPLIPITPEETKSYGVPSIAERLDNGIVRIDGITEKPGPKEARSSYAVVGGYVLTKEVVRELEHVKPDATGEVYLTDALDRIARTSPLYGKILDGTWRDTGNKQRYLEAIVDFALADHKLGPGFKQYLRGKLDEIQSS